MKTLLSLPPNLVECFYDITNADRKEWFCTSDPKDRKLGSGGGTAWLLKECIENDSDNQQIDWLQNLPSWLADERSEPTSAKLCAIGKSTHPYSYLQMGTRTETHAELTFVTASAVQPHYAEGTWLSAHSYRQWRRVYPRF